MKAALTPAMMRLAEAWRKTAGLPPGERKAALNLLIKSPKFVVNVEAMFGRLIEEYGDILPRRADLHLPYPVTVVEISYGPVAIVVVLTEKGAINATVSVVRENGIAACGYQLDNLADRPRPVHDDQSEDFVRSVHEDVYALMLLLSVPSLPRQHAGRAMSVYGIGAPRDRITYIDLGPKYRILGAKSGSHASPVGHLRRGHPRHLRDGRTVWVRPTKINGGPKDALRLYEFRPGELRDDQIVEASTDRAQ